jgi:hypothetical protein
MPENLSGLLYTINAGVSETMRVRGAFAERHCGLPENRFAGRRCWPWPLGSLCRPALVCPCSRGASPRRVYLPVAADFLVKKTFRHYHLSSDFTAWLTGKHVMGE